jgi:formylglycine-generating enzyme required for sulfatase activity
MAHLNSLTALLTRTSTTSAPTRRRSAAIVRVLLSGVVAVAMAFGFSPSTAHGQSGCASDINGDGVVSADDLAIVLSSWGPCPGKGSCASDLNGDGVVSADDLAILMSSWGEVCLSTVTSVTPLSGATSGGTEITINGTHLGGTLAVEVGGVACTNLQVLSSTLVKAVTPAAKSSGAVAITVINAAGTATAADAFTYVSVTVPAWATLIEALPDPAVVTDATLRDAITASGFAWRIRDNSSNIEMLLVPPSTFQMGCIMGSDFNGCNSWELPVHTVTLTNAYYLGRYEVTQAQWQAKMGSNPSEFQPPFYTADTSRPVERVSWNTIQNFNSATGLRLPTEAEWEFACRAGTTTPFHSGPGFPNGTTNEVLARIIAWYGPNSGGVTHAVGGKAANALGMHDMLGNVWEWQSDWYGGYSSSAQTNPTGPGSGSARVLRGGAWYNFTNIMRSSGRDSSTPDYTGLYIGFRVARTPRNPPPTISSVSPNRGLVDGGTEITITGTHLGSTLAVEVGGVACTSLQVLSSTLVKAVTPAAKSSGAVAITVINAAGTATAANAFTYVSPIVPTWATLIEAMPDPAVVTEATLRDAIFASGFAWRVRDNSSGIEMLLVPPSTFPMGCIMGSDSYGCYSYEQPVHTVTLTNAYYLGRYEVTQAQWQAKMGSNPSAFQGQADSPSRPVERVSWNMIQNFNSATGLRLPTEAEWEFACRAGTITPFHSGPGFPNGTTNDGLVGTIAWYTANAGNVTHAVGGKAANALGMHDMLGNVYEWCSDWWGNYSSSAQTNPTGPATGTNRRVLRGGSWSNGTAAVRSSNRHNFNPLQTNNLFGFRVARAPLDPPPTISSVSPNTGLIDGGTAITITGTNLSGATSVTIGGVPGTNVVAVSSTTVTAVTPAGSVGSTSVEVTVPQGTATAADAFTYVSPIVPTWATLIEALPDPAVVTNANLRDAITASGFAWRIRDNSSNIEMLLVPPSTFEMGCIMGSDSYGCDGEELPVHTVTLTSAYYLGRYEVTQAQWQAQMGSNPSYFTGQADSPSRPVERVSWNMIQGFNSATGLRLPTEAEWEFACRAGTTTPFHSGPGFPNGTTNDGLAGTIAWYAPNSGNVTHAVGGKAANALGMHDMLGNVWEWQSDWYGDYSSSAQTNPTGPGGGSYRVVRGGAWYVFTFYVRSSNRYNIAPDDSINVIGFRVARDPS